MFASVGYAVCTSTGEVGRLAIKVMGPIVLCLADFSVTIEIDHSVWKQSYNACPTVHVVVHVDGPSTRLVETAH